jgi:small nuclear ribonucleoprotein (snRNP)-like protein
MTLTELTSMSRGGMQYNPFTARNCDSEGVASPMTAVRRYLGRRLRVFLYEGRRHILGVFVALEPTETMVLRDAVDIRADHDDRLGMVRIPLNYVWRIETADR